LGEKEKRRIIVCGETQFPGSCLSRLMVLVSLSFATQESLCTSLGNIVIPQVLPSPTEEKGIAKFEIKALISPHMNDCHQHPNPANKTPLTISRCLSTNNLTT
jgi:hypothetical protein